MEVSINLGPQTEWKILLKWMVWGYHHFRTPPYYWTLTLLYKGQIPREAFPSKHMCCRVTFIVKFWSFVSCFWLVASCSFGLNAFVSRENLPSYRSGLSHQPTLTAWSVWSVDVEPAKSPRPTSGPCGPCITRHGRTESFAKSGTRSERSYRSIGPQLGGQSRHPTVNRLWQ